MVDSPLLQQLQSAPADAYGCRLGGTSSRRSRSFRGRSRSEALSADHVSIELPQAADLSDENLTSVALHQCKKKVLKPYMLLLQLLAWSPWMGGTWSHCADQCCHFLNLLYVGFVFCLLIVGYLLQFASCVSRDHPPYSLPSDYVLLNNCSEAEGVALRHLEVCSNPVSTYFFSNALHFLSYLYAFYVFRWRENEELKTVMEKAFIQTTSAKTKGFQSQGRLSKEIRAILLVGVMWLVLQFLSNVLVILGRLLDCRVTPKWRVGFSSWIAVGDQLSVEAMWILVILMVTGFLAFDLVYIAVAVNYCAQCQLLIFLIRGMNERIEEKNTTLQRAIREYHNAGKFIVSLNQQLAIAMSLLEVNLIAHAIVSILSLYDLDSSYTSEMTGVLFLIAAIMYIILWTAIGLFGFVQAARLSSACRSTVKVALQIRSFGYPDASPMEVDSFILYITSQKCSAKLFRVPIYSHYVWAIVSTGLIAVLVLVELGFFQISLKL